MDSQIVSSFLSLQAIVRHPYMYMMLLFPWGRFPKMGFCVLNFNRHCQTICQKCYSLLYSFILTSLPAMNIIGIYNFGKYTRWKRIFHYFNLHIWVSSYLYYLWIISVSSFKNWLFKSIAHILSYFLLLICRCSLYMLGLLNGLQIFFSLTLHLVWL